MSNLDISITQDDQATIIRLSGSADMQEANLLNQHLEKVFEQNCYTLVIDLSELKFTSSMGLGSLIMAHSTCKEHKGRLVILNPQPAVMKIFKTTRLDQLFNIFKSLEEAKKAIFEG